MEAPERFAAISSVPLDHPALLSLTRALDAELRNLYGSVQDGYDGLNRLSGDMEAFVILAEGEPAGCACLKSLGDGEGEVKRVYVAPRYREKGFSKALMAAIEGRARAVGVTRLILETGVKQSAAVALYRGLGYQAIPNYGEYEGNTNSICMVKTLGQSADQVLEGVVEQGQSVLDAFG